MSSSSSSQPSMASMTSPSRYKNSSEYRIAEYYDGRVLRIHESRRRSHVTGLPAHSASKRDDGSPGTYDKKTLMEKSSSTDHGARLSTGSSDMDLNPISHVTAAARSSPKAKTKTKTKAVIIQEPKPLRIADQSIFPLFEKATMLTPPPTPKIERLLTPELADLDESPFCDCCVETHVIKYCASCGSGIYRC